MSVSSGGRLRAEGGLEVHQPAGGPFCFEALQLRLTGAQTVAANFGPGNLIRIECAFNEAEYGRLSVGRMTWDTASGFVMHEATLTWSDAFQPIIDFLQNVWEAIESIPFAQDLAAAVLIVVAPGTTARVIGDLISQAAAGVEQFLCAGEIAALTVGMILDPFAAALSDTYYRYKARHDYQNWDLSGAPPELPDRLLAMGLGVSIELRRIDRRIRQQTAGVNHYVSRAEEPLATFAGIDPHTLGMIAEALSDELGFVLNIGQESPAEVVDLLLETGWLNFRTDPAEYAAERVRELERYLQSLRGQSLDELMTRCDWGSSD